MKLFVSIASYNDPLLKHTIHSCYTNAKHKKNLVFGVFNQSEENLEVNSNINIRQKKCNPLDSLGVCWARSKIQTDLLEDEDLFLQIDSHTMFTQDWDEYLIAEYNKAKNWIDKPIITGYPRSFYSIPTDKAFNLDKEFVFIPKGNPKTDNFTVVITAEKPFNSGLHCSPNSKTLAPKQYKGFLLSAGFLLTERQWVVDVPYDPQIYFTGEESTLALRSFTFGYDIVHVPNVPVWHEYNTKENKISRKVHWETETKTPVSELVNAGGKRKDVVLSGSDTGKYGIGSRRSLKEYACLSGIDYEQKKYFVEKAMFTTYESTGR